MIKYSKIQYSKLVIVLFLPIIVVIFYLYLDSNSMPLIPTILIITVLLIALLFFYKLTITIDNNKITARFGIGLLKRTVLIKDIDFNTLEKVNFSLLTGIGLRLTSKGWLWNVKVGDAIYFKSKNNKTFLVGTDEFGIIVKHLKQ